MNLDPAVTTVPFAANIDIRDTVNYKEVMGQYQLGPNGAIMTSLNLFATRFDQVRFRFLQLNSKGFSPQGNSPVVTYSCVSCLSACCRCCRSWRRGRMSWTTSSSTHQVREMGVG